MKSDLQPPEQRLAELQDQMRQCQRCIQAGYHVMGPAVFSGSISARVMVIGQAPAKADLDAGSIPWSGAGGARLMSWLEGAGFNPDRIRCQHYFSALTRCYPGKGAAGRGDRAPSAAEIALCTPYLRSELALIRPSLILLVGRLAIEHFLGKGKLTEWVGQAFPAGKRVASEWRGCLRSDAWLVPLPHPSGANLWLNQPMHQHLVQQAITILFDLRRRLEV